MRFASRAPAKAAPALPTVRFLGFGFVRPDAAQVRCATRDVPRARDVLKKRFGAVQVTLIGGEIEGAHER